MGLVALVVVGAAVVAALAGGRWRDLAGLRVGAKPLVALAVLAQVVGAEVADHSGKSWFYTAGLALSAGCALVFCLANLRIAGIPLVALGLVANALVVARNGAMPVSIYSAHRAGVSIRSIAFGDDPRHTIAGPQSQLRSLGDVIPVPIPGAREVVSAGDVLVAAGLGEFVVVTSRRRRGSGSGDAQDAGGASSHAAQALSTISRKS